MSSIWDYEDLARHLCGLADDDDGTDLDDALCEKVGLDLCEFAKLVEMLMPLVAVGKSPLTDKTYRGFAVGDVWLLKTETAT